MTGTGSDTQTWASEEFATLDLNHAARDACGRAVLAMLARGVGTRVTSFTETPAERQQAYGFIENESVDPKALTKAAADAALKRLDAESPWCIVPVDGSSLNLADTHGKKGFGRVGGHDSTRGLIVQTALALDNEGTPLGVLAQVYWSRALAKAPTGTKAARRKIDEKEVRHWLDVVSAAEAAGVDAGVDGRLWFQLDRGYDCSPMLEAMATSLNRFTIRSEYNRALWIDDAVEDDPEAEPTHKYVRDALDAAPVLKELLLEVQGGAGRTARTARLEVQVARVPVRLSDASRRRTVRGVDGKRRKLVDAWPRELTAVRVREIAAPEDGTPALMWTLWVNAEVADAAAAEAVVRAYAQRWRVEEFHKMWKSGAMQVEEIQVRSVENVERIARMAALVACRLLRVTHLARTRPDAEASSEFSRAELAVMKVMDPRSKRQKPRPERIGSMAWAVAVIADMGGYTGKSSGGPPGPLVLARGLERMVERAEGFAAAMRIRDQW